MRLSKILIWAVVVGLGARAANSQAILGTSGETTEAALVFPTPGAGLPTPTQVAITGLPAGASPHGVGYFGPDNALVSDFGNYRIHNVRVSTASVVATIDTTAVGYSGTGTIAVSPNLAYALAMGSTATLHVIAAPFNASAPISSVTLPNQIASYQTQAIVFDAAGRAFVSHKSGISVLDPPYSSVAFTIPLSNSTSGALAITPDGTQLLATTAGTAVSIFTAPFSAASTPVLRAIAGSSGLDGIKVTPDGTQALVACAFDPEVYVLNAPFNASSTIAQIPLSAAYVDEGYGFEDLDISADGTLAIVTGNGGADLTAEPTPFIQVDVNGKFSASSPVSDVSVNSNHRGAGAVRFRRSSFAGPPLLGAGAISIDDSGGNGNGALDFNECAGFDLALENSGASGVTNVSVTLTTDTPGVAVTQNASLYPDIAAFSSESNLTPFQLSLAPDFVAGTVIAISAVVVTDQGGFVVPVNLASGTLVTDSFALTQQVAIPDDDPTGATLPIVASGIAQPIARVRVGLHVTHTYVGDLTLRLIGPDGTPLTLIGGRGGDGDNFGVDCPASANDTTLSDDATPPIGGGTAPFSGEFRPEEAFAAFAGKTGGSANGSWELRAIDPFAFDTGNIECARLEIDSYTSTDGGGMCNAPLAQAVALLVDPDGNEILETGESATVAPTWLNSGPAAATGLAGTAADFGGNVTTTYVLADGSAAYGDISSASQATCGADCFAVSIANPVTRALHWDAAFEETLTTATVKTWSLHVGGSFADVPDGDDAYLSAETLLHRGVTAGCSGTDYCPQGPLTRQQMAVLLLRAKEGPGYSPPACMWFATAFADVPSASPFCSWVEEAARRGVVASCGGGNYCPLAPITRLQFPYYHLRMLEGATYAPPACSPSPFLDVPATDPLCPYVQEAFSRGIVAGCGGGNYCPTHALRRDQLADDLMISFGLLLYAP